MPTCQKRAPDIITDDCEPPCGCWESNSAPLEDQSVLLTSEPSLQFFCDFKKNALSVHYSQHQFEWFTVGFIFLSGLIHMLFTLEQQYILLRHGMLMMG